MLKSILEFILDEKKLNHFFILAVFLFPVSGLVIGTIYKIGVSKKQQSILTGIFWGVTGGLISGMWFVYNSIMNHYGLDSVKALVINLFIFILMGTVLGIVYRRLGNRKSGTGE